jgi:RNA polymerase sigma-70 factor, ECF subfamily
VDEERFLRLLEEHGPALMRLSAAYARTAADRDDLFQEICFALWRALPGFRGQCSLRTFVFRIGHNRGLTHRTRHRWMAPLDEVPELPSADRPIDDALDARQRADVLLAAVRRLPELQRQAIVLHLEGLTTGEIADVLGISETNAAVRLSRARRALRDALPHALADR